MALLVQLGFADALALGRSPCVPTSLNLASTRDLLLFISRVFKLVSLFLLSFLYLFHVSFRFERALDDFNFLAAPADALSQVFLLMRVLMQDLAMRLLRQLSVSSELAVARLLGQLNRPACDGRSLRVLSLQLLAHSPGYALALQRGQVRLSVVKQCWIVADFCFRASFAAELVAIELLELTEGQVQVAQSDQLALAIANCFFRHESLKELIHFLALLLRHFIVVMGDEPELLEEHFGDFCRDALPLQTGFQVRDDLSYAVERRLVGRSLGFVFLENHARTAATLLLGKSGLFLDCKRAARVLVFMMGCQRGRCEEVR